MTVVLGIDTSSSLCAVAAVSGETSVPSRTSGRPRAHAELLMGMIEECMDAVTPGRRGPDAVAVSGGPGSFTGLRIGFSVAKGLCSAGGAILVVVPTFEAWTTEAAARAGVPDGTPILATMPAGRGEAHLAAFRRAGDAVEAVHAPRIAPVDGLSRIAAEWGSLLVVGESRSQLDAWFPPGDRPAVLAVVDDGLDVARRVARIGLTRIEAGESSDPATAEPMYLREFSTTQPKTQGGVH